MWKFSLKWYNIIELFTIQKGANKSWCPQTWPGNKICLDTHEIVFLEDKKMKCLSTRSKLIFFNNINITLTLHKSHRNIYGLLKLFVKREKKNICEMAAVHSIHWQILYLRF